MITIDGATGGGQILRSALSLSVIQQTPVTIEHVRGGRSRPGLRPQHLAGLDCLTELTSAEVEGATVGSEHVVFDPQHPPHGEVDIDISTAGSITLLFETIIPLGPVLEAPIAVTAAGGTDVKWSPTMDYLSFVKLPLLEAHGLETSLAIQQRGYYPEGGGRATLTVHPGEFDRFDLTEGASITSVSIHSHASESLADASVAQRQLDGATKALEAAGIEVSDATHAYHDVPSTGTSLTVVAEDGCHAGGDALGERGKPAEEVGEEAVLDLQRGTTEGAAVDRYLADQLMLPLALGGGTITIPAVTDHVETNAEVIEAFDLDLLLDTSADAPHRLTA